MPGQEVAGGRALLQGFGSNTLTGYRPGTQSGSPCPPGQEHCNYQNACINLQTNSLNCGVLPRCRCAACTWPCLQSSLRTCLHVHSPCCGCTQGCPCMTGTPYDAEPRAGRCANACDFNTEVCSSGRCTCKPGTTFCQNVGKCFSNCNGFEREAGIAQAQPEGLIGGGAFGSAASDTALPG